MNFLDMKVDDPGIFRLCKAVNLADYARKVDSNTRCDAKGWGPVAVNWDPNGDFFGRKTSNIVVANIYDYHMLVDCAPYFYIIYYKYKNYEDPDGAPEPQSMIEDAWNDHPETVAPTLGHLFRLMIEWDYTLHDPFNTPSPQAWISHNALSILGMTSTLRGYFLKNYPDMPVAKYFKEIPTAKDFPENGIMTKSIQNFLEGVITNYPKRPSLETFWDRFVEVESNHETYV